MTDVGEDNPAGNGGETGSPFDSLIPSVFYGAIYPNVKEDVVFFSEKDNPWWHFDNTPWALFCGGV